MSLVLYPYQFKLKLEHYAAWSHGANHNLVVLPTGGGKSKLVASIVQDQVRVGKPGTIKAHRNELVSQMSIHIASVGIPHRIVGNDQMIRAVVSKHRDAFGGRSYVQQDAITTVGSVDTINARSDSMTEWNLQQDYWITDEAHHLLRENKWGRTASYMPNARGLGVTATPSRADGKGLGAEADGVFNSMCIGPSMRELINMGYLTDYEIATPKASFLMDESDITASGDYSPERMRTKARESRIVGDVVETYSRLALGKQAICFATDVETSEKIAKRFNEAGISAAAVSAKTHATIRDAIVERFRTGKLTVLVNVDLFGEGFDVPACEVVIMARPTASLAVYLQQFGRALRILPGKLFGLVIDHVENWRVHSLPDIPRQWTLDRRTKRKKRDTDPDDMPLRRCVNDECGKVYLRFLPSCPFCGSAPVPAGRARPEEVEGDLALMDRAMLDRMRAAIELESPASVAQRVSFQSGIQNPNDILGKQSAKIAAQSRLRDTIEQWAGIQRHLGRDDRESYKRFFHSTGMDVLTALADRPASEYEAMTERVNEWIGRYANRV